MTGMVRDMKPDTARMKKAAGAGYATATDLADWLVRTLEAAVPRGASRRPAGSSPRRRRQGVALHRLPLAAMQAIEPRITEAVLRRAVGRALGDEPDELRRHRAQERACAGQEMAEQAGQKSNA